MDKLIFSGKAVAPQLTDIISEGGHICIVVTGSSMRPFLKDGRDVVCLRICEDKDIKCGRILLFQRQDRSLVLHRIRKILPDGKLLINGDGQTWCETIHKGQIIAVVSSVERKGQHISCDSIWLRIWNWLWYPTRPFRPVLFKLWHILFSHKEDHDGSPG